MKLNEYRNKCKISQKKAAQELGVSQEAIVSWERRGSKKKIPRLKMMMKILKWSNGAVTANDFYGIGEREEK